MYYCIEKYVQTFKINHPLNHLDVALHLFIYRIALHNMLLRDTALEWSVWMRG